MNLPTTLLLHYKVALMANKPQQEGITTKPG